MEKMIEKNNRKVKEKKKSWGNWGKVFSQKKKKWWKYGVGTEPSALVYIGILVTPTTTGPGGSVVSPLASVDQPPLVARVFPPYLFSILPFQPLMYVLVNNKTYHTMYCQYVRPSK